MEHQDQTASAPKQWATLMSFALITGVIHKGPEEKLSKNNRRYAVCSIRSGMGENVEWWRVTCFADTAVDALLELSEGDGLSAAGVLQVSVYAPEGKDPRATSLSWPIKSSAPAPRRTAPPVSAARVAAGIVAAVRKTRHRGPQERRADWRARGRDGPQAPSRPRTADAPLRRRGAFRAKRRNPVVRAAVS